MSYPIANIRYSLDTFEWSWANLSFGLDSDINIHYNNPKTTPLTDDYLMNDDLYTGIHLSLCHGLISMQYISSLTNPMSPIDKFLYCATYIEILSMSLYDESQFSPPQEFATNSVSILDVQNIVTQDTIELTKWDMHFGQKSLYVDQDDCMKMIQQNKIPHNNIILRIIWLLCDILRIIRSLPFPISHPCIQQLLNLSTDLWELLRLTLIIVTSCSSTISLRSIYSLIWDVYPNCEEFILANLTVPLVQALDENAITMEIFQRFFMRPLPLIRHLESYQAYYPSVSTSHSILTPQFHPHPPHYLQHSQPIPFSNQHSSNNFFLLLSQYSSLGPSQPLLLFGQITLQPSRSNLSRSFNDEFLQNVIAAHMKRLQISKSIIQTPNQNVEIYSKDKMFSSNIRPPFADLTHLISSASISPSSLPLTSIPSLLSIAGDTLQIPHLFAFLESQGDLLYQEHILTFTPVTIQTNLSRCVSQILEHLTLRTFNETAIFATNTSSTSFNSGQSPIPTSAQTSAFVNNNKPAKSTSKDYSDIATYDNLVSTGIGLKDKSTNSTIDPLFSMSDSFYTQDGWDMPDD